jgi:hypothetical protein
MRYFELLDDISMPGHWALSDPTDESGREVANPWMFMKGEPVRVEGRLKIPVDRPGRSLDFTLAGIGVTPVVHARVASVLTQLAPADVQVLPVQVGEESEPYVIVNVTRTVRCIDDEASAEVRYWKPEDGQPNKVGRYKSVIGMRIDPSKVGDARVFRTWGWTIALVVSEDIKEALERAGVTGVKFEEVTGPSAVSTQERALNRKLIALREQTDTARQAFWHTLGKLDEEVIIPIVVGGPWPARRQVWRVIHRPEEQTLLVTDGLSDFFVAQAEPSVGFGVELALETNEPLGNVEKSWPLLLLERVGDEVAGHERVREQLKGGFMSMEVSGKGMPEPLVTKDGRIGALLGIETNTLPGRFDMPSGQVRLVTVKALMPTELAYLLEHGKPGRDELIRRFHQQGLAHLSRSWRQPVV